jgi:hypothetical protein
VLASVEPEAAGPLQEVWKDQLTREQLQQPFAQVARGWTREQWEKLFVAAQVLEDLLARPTARLAQLPGYADAMAEMLSKSQEYNFVKWKILGESVGANPDDIAAEDTYSGQVELMKAFLRTRTSYVQNFIEALE